MGFVAVRWVGDREEEEEEAHCGEEEEKGGRAPILGCTN